MVTLSGLSFAEINALLAQSHAFEIAFDRERTKLESILRGSRLFYALI